MQCKFENNDQSLWKFWVSILGVIPVYIGTVKNFYDFLDSFLSNRNKYSWPLVSTFYGSVYLLYALLLILDYKEKQQKDLENNEEIDTWDSLKTRLVKEKLSLTRRYFYSY